jgi:hypothetical protein
MSRTIDYSDLSEDQKIAKALEDLKEWYGKDKFEQLSSEWKAVFPEEASSWAYFAKTVSISGVYGYPVEVWYKQLWPDAEIPEDLS